MKPEIGTRWRDKHGVLWTCHGATDELITLRRGYRENGCDVIEVQPLPPKLFRTLFRPDEP